MFDVSPDGANLWFDISNLVLLVGAVLVALGTYGTIKFSGIKEKFSDERIAANEAETKRAVADSDIAKQGAAEAHARAAEAQLELEKFRAPRSLTAEQRARIVAALNKFSGQEYAITTFWDLKEPLAFAELLHQLFQNAGWKFVNDGPRGFLLGGLSGVQIWVHSDADPSTKEAANALADALKAEQFEAQVRMQNPQNNPKHNRIALNVGTKQ